MFFSFRQDRGRGLPGQGGPQARGYLRGLHLLGVLGGPRALAGRWTLGNQLVEGTPPPQMKEQNTKQTSKKVRVRGAIWGLIEKASPARCPFSPSFLVGRVPLLKC